MMKLKNCYVSNIRMKIIFMVGQCSKGFQLIILNGDRSEKAKNGFEKYFLS